MNAFETWAAITFGVEGGDVSTDRSDPGNYRPDGSFGGSQWGLSAREFPDLVFPIPKETALPIMKTKYWDVHNLDALPAPFAILMADAYYNGADRPAEWLQEAVGVTVDNDVGPHTITAAQHAASDPAAIGEFAAKHLNYHASLDRPADELGWARRDVTTLLAALRAAGVLTS